MREGNAAAGEDRDASGMRQLFQQQHFRARVMRGDGRDRARKAITYDNDINFLIPVETHLLRYDISPPVDRTRPVRRGL